MPILPHDAIEHSIQEHYERFAASGLTYEHEFACVRSLMSPSQKDAGALAWGVVSLPESIDMQGYFFHPALLDGCLQVTMSVIKEHAGAAWMPVGVKEYRFHRSPESRDVVSIVRQVQKHENQFVQIDLDVVDASNSLVAEIRGLTLKEVSYHAEALLGVGLAQSPPGMDEAKERPLLDPSHRVPIFVKSRIASILDLSADELDLSLPLIDLGMDSIMAIELRNDILTELQIELSMEELLEILTPNDLIARLFERLEGQEKQDELSPQSDWVEGAI